MKIFILTLLPLAVMGGLRGNKEPAIHTVKVVGSDRSAPGSDANFIIQAKQILEDGTSVGRFSDVWNIRKGPGLVGGTVECMKVQFDLEYNGYDAAAVIFGTITKVNNPDIEELIEEPYFSVLAMNPNEATGIWVKEYFDLYLNQASIDTKIFFQNLMGDIDFSCDVIKDYFDELELDGEDGLIAALDNIPDDAGADQFTELPAGKVLIK